VSEDALAGIRQARGLGAQSLLARRGPQKPLIPARPVSPLLA